MKPKRQSIARRKGKKKPTCEADAEALYLRLNREIAAHGDEAVPETPAEDGDGWAPLDADDFVNAELGDSLDTERIVPDPDLAPGLIDLELDVEEPEEAPSTTADLTISSSAAEESRTSGVPVVLSNGTNHDPPGLPSPPPDVPEGGEEEDEEDEEDDDADDDDDLVETASSFSISRAALIAGVKRAIEIRDRQRRARDCDGGEYEDRSEEDDSSEEDDTSEEDDSREEVDSSEEDDSSGDGNSREDDEGREDDEATEDRLNGENRVESGKEPNAENGVSSGSRQESYGREQLPTTVSSTVSTASAAPLISISIPYCSRTTAITIGTGFSTATGRRKRPLGKLGEDVTASPTAELQRIDEDNAMEGDRQVQTKRRATEETRDEYLARKRRRREVEEAEAEAERLERMAEEYENNVRRQWEQSFEMLGILKDSFADMYTMNERLCLGPHPRGRAVPPRQLPPPPEEIAKAAKAPPGDLGDGGEDDGEDDVNSWGDWSEVSDPFDFSAAARGEAPSPMPPEIRVEALRRRYAMPTTPPDSMS